ncbi:MAG: prolyl oligopeptidase family serine peptidase [Cyclobacteriaceae bacterium]
MKSYITALSLLLLFWSCSRTPEITKAGNYPVSLKVDTIDQYFGTAVADPYRWLENDTAALTTQWVEAQNKVTFGYLENIPYRETIRKRINALNDYEKISAPSREGEHLYWYRNSGLQNQSVLYRKKGEQGQPEVFLDPNTFSADGTSALQGTFFTSDGSMLAYMISEGGSDWRKAVIIKTSDKTMVGDTIRNLKFTGIAWKGNEGFYYSRTEGDKLFSRVDYNTLMYHKLGTPQSQDNVVFNGNINPPRRVGAYLTEDERFLVMSASTTTSGNELYIQDLSKAGSKLIAATENFDNEHQVVDNTDNRLIIYTNLNAPNGKVVEASSDTPQSKNWKDIIPEEKEAIQSVNAAGGKLFVNYLKDARTVIKQFDRNGKFEREVQLPGIGTASGFSGRSSDTYVYYTFTSFIDPTSVYKYDIASGKSELYQRPKVDFNPEEYETRQVFYNSKDGTKIPMFITMKKGLKLDGKNPTWLYSYGGFNISLLPSFSSSRIVWLENGGIYAVPNIRGGGEYGEAWHLAGTKMNKQNVFDDFIAAGEYLISKKYTSSQYLAIAGGSNGGLLVGATMTQRPDLAKIAFPAVGVMDMLRYHRFTVGDAWKYDYGRSIDSKEMFEYLHRYSPVHALKPNTNYPATMVTTADHDDRVVPAHSFKFAATLQENHVGDNPVLIRIDTKSGHGSSNLSKAIELTADQYAFAWYNMQVLPPLAKKDM